MSKISIEGIPVALVSGDGDAGSFPVSGSGHLLLIYTDDAGNESVIHGGPTHPLDKYLSYGAIQMQIDVPIGLSADRRVDGAGNPVTPASRGNREIDLGDRKAQDVWTLLKEQASNIQGQYLPYSPTGDNSNAVVGNLLHLVGVDIDNTIPDPAGVMLIDFSGKDRPFTFDYAIKGTDSNDTIVGGAGAETFTGGKGDDTLTGGDGDDTAIYAGKPSDYDIIHNPDDTWTIDDVRGDATDGRDTLKDVEYARFGDDTTITLKPNLVSSQLDLSSSSTPPAACRPTSMQ